MYRKKFRPHGVFVVPDEMSPPDLSKERQHHFEKQSPKVTYRLRSEWELTDRKRSKGIASQGLAPLGTSNGP